MTSKPISALVLAAALVPAQANCQMLTGTATAADGDSLVIGSQRVRLVGIDAPELDQSCVTGTDSWQCGERSKQQLGDLVAGQRIDCQVTGIDQYGRSLAICATELLQLNEAMVELGWAVAYREYSDEYVEAEGRAKLRKAGIWNSTFTMPSAHRLAHAPQRSTEPRKPGGSVSRQTNASSAGCAIKGNRNRRGEWIYHLPGMPYYDVTRAEDFFCTEAQARAAGYRRAIVK